MSVTSAQIRSCPITTTHFLAEVRSQQTLTPVFKSPWRHLAQLPVQTLQPLTPAALCIDPTHVKKTAHNQAIARIYLLGITVVILRIT